MKNRIISHAGITVDMETLKCFKLTSFSGIGTQNTLIIEFKKRIEFIKNPDTEKIEKVELKDFSEVEFPDYDTAVVYKEEWESIWEQYLNED